MVRLHKMLRLSDTSIRLYRKRDWSVAVRLHSYLMVYCKDSRGFRLSAYLNQFDCSTTFEDGRTVVLDDYSYTYDCLYRMNHMIHEFWASGRIAMDTIKDGAALLRIEYRLFSYKGQGNSSLIEVVVPVLARGIRAHRWSREAKSPA